jgi:hypothetical protein
MTIIEPRADDTRLSGLAYLEKISIVAHWWVGVPRQSDKEFIPSNSKDLKDDIARALSR